MISKHFISQVTHTQLLLLIFTQITIPVKRGPSESLTQGETRRARLSLVDTSTQNNTSTSIVNNDDEEPTNEYGDKYQGEWKDYLSLLLLILN